MIERWKGMSRGERLKWQVVIAFMTVAVYGLAVYPPLHKDYQSAKNMLNRSRDRMEKRADISKVSIEGVGPAALEKRIAEAREKLAAIEGDSEDLDSWFPASGDKEARQQQLLELATLSERIGMEIVSITDKPAPGAGGGNKTKPAKKASKKDAQEDDAAKAPPPLEAARPRLVIKANASFTQVLEFLDGLADLSFITCATNLKLYASPADAPGGARDKSSKAKAGRLYVILEVSV
ncbi:MAG: hypothetical protein LBT74_09400 [Acidobacteriota bacterium]|jgi:hypothetical protein|nr:hypothetical protein [Acidobacteriota bacterium]